MIGCVARDACQYDSEELAPHLRHDLFFFARLPAHLQMLWHAANIVVQLAGVAPPSGYVRASLSCGGYDCTPRPDGGCDLTYVNILDPNGHIPTWVVNRLVPDRALTVARLRNCLIKR